MTFVTAEIGTSWQGDFKILEMMLEEISDSSINAVKFQCLTQELIDRHNELFYYKDASISKENIVKVVDLCEKWDIEFYTTITNSDQLEFVLPYVSKLKIRCIDSHNDRLIDECYSTGKEIIVSSLRPLTQYGKKIKNLYCIPRYPVPLGEINFELMKSFDGYSNHCKNPLGILIPNYSNDYLEFHVTPSTEYFLIDNSVSFDLFQTREIMRILRSLEIG